MYTKQRKTWRPWDREMKRAIECSNVVFRERRNAFAAAVDDDAEEFMQHKEDKVQFPTDLDNEESPLDSDKDDDLYEENKKEDMFSEEHSTSNINCNSSSDINRISSKKKNAILV